MRAAELAEHLDLDEAQVWGIAEHLITEGNPICFRLEDSSIFSAVAEYWLADSDQDVAETAAIMARAAEAMAHAAAGMERASSIMRSAQVN